jgi:hypothetical protein
VILVPIEVEKLMDEGEVIDHRLLLPKNEIFTSPYRMFIKHSGKVEVIEYANIMNLEIRKKRKWITIIIGLAIIIITLCLNQINPPDWVSFFKFIYSYDSFVGYILFLLGTLLVITSLLSRMKSIKFRMVDIKEGWVISGHRKTIDTLFQSIIERRTQPKETDMQ